MAKRKIGIQERTAVEESILSPVEKHQQLQHLIPMQTEDCMRFVRLRNVQKKIGLGWVVKSQNRLHDAKVELARQVHAALTEKKISQIKANKLITLADEATVTTLKKVQDEISEALKPAQAKGIAASIIGLLIFHIFHF